MRFVKVKTVHHEPLGDGLHRQVGVVGGEDQLLY